jgi:hypothetical protein
LLGLREAKEMKIQHLKVHGDSELIVQQVRNVYQTKNIQLKDYRNEVWDIVEAFFLSFNIVYIPRNQNEQVDSLVVAASTFKPPLPPKLKYEVEVRYSLLFQTMSSIGEFLRKILKSKGSLKL